MKYEMLDVLFDKKLNKFYIVANEKEVLTQSGEFVGIDTIDLVNVINMGLIHTRPNLVEMFK